MTDEGDTPNMSKHHMTTIVDKAEELAADNTIALLTEQDLEQFKRDQGSPREEAHAATAIHIALTRGIFRPVNTLALRTAPGIQYATADDHKQLVTWLNAMRHMSQACTPSDPQWVENAGDDTLNITELSQVLYSNNTGDTCIC